MTSHIRQVDRCYNQQGLFISSHTSIPVITAGLAINVILSHSPYLQVISNSISQTVSDELIRRDGTAFIVDSFQLLVVFDIFVQLY